ncbi:MAG: 2,3-bisphosphoglycerate-independent phosphoglycerate mutase [Gemmatimonadota bacterium]
MSRIRIPDALVETGGGTILLVVLDGLGGLPDPESGKTELETAAAPNLDALAARSSLGMHIPVAPGVTPGSGPAHLALFGYDPTEFLIGRGALSALGVGFELKRGDVAARLNLATFDSEGRVVDRRAGRPSDDEGRRAVEIMRSEVRLPDDVEFFVLHEKEHRAVLVLRGEGLAADIAETDPQETGVPPLDAVALAAGSARTAELLRVFLTGARTALAGESRINGVLARGFALHDGIPSIQERFGMGGTAVAAYPMYRGVARLVGMDIPGAPKNDDEAVSLLEEHFGTHAFHFIHFKAPDARGEDGDFAGKAAAIERVDAVFPRLLALGADVVLVTGDHSTPAAMRKHSWHPVPFLLASSWARPTGRAFSESACRGGDLGTVEARHLMSLALAHAGRMAKFGA